jgi:hypothetical protein
MSPPAGRDFSRLADFRCRLVATLCVSVGEAESKIKRKRKRKKRSRSKRE